MLLKLFLASSLVYVFGKQRFVHISDIHLDSFFSPYAKSKEQCHRGVSNETRSFGAFGCDSPHSLTDGIIKYISSLKDINFVLFSGDSRRHESDEQLPVTEGETLWTNNRVSHKFSRLMPNTSIVFAIGNNDVFPKFQFSYNLQLFYKN
jgi:endopolyphosphatase